MKVICGSCRRPMKLLPGQYIIKGCPTGYLYPYTSYNCTDCTRSVDIITGPALSPRLSYYDHLSKNVKPLFDE